MIIDTDVLIWYMRGDERAREVVEDSGDFDISVVTQIELIQGLRSKAELRELRHALGEWSVRVLFVNEEVSAKALLLVERYFLSHALELADALIAATAISRGVPLVTGNARHYRQIPELEIRIFRR